MAALRLPKIRNNPSKIQLERISHVYFDHEDMGSFEEFAKNFGFVEIGRDKDLTFYRGYGKDPYCYVARKVPKGGKAYKGAAFVAQTQGDFDKAAALDGAETTDLIHPGGGRLVTLKTPSGFYLYVLYGQQERQVSEPAPPSATVENLGLPNGSFKKQRLGEFQRFHPGPAMIHKLGHVGYILNNWYEEADWYTSNFNFVPTDVQWHPQDENVDVIAFIHLDLGERYSDHHSLFLARAQPGDHDHMHHTSYEVEDFDTQLLGHEWLANKKYHSVWGVGRHILGSQIFDYWRDTSGFTIEHYTDGDLVNVNTDTVRSQAGPLAIWGPELPKDFSEDHSVV
ncbi:Glyoxalase/Bleomycin resistance protein/Dihydroxybiphenyl dioxygenase [Mytilinidion resinicola]|uniref:Glyoxalase/Bleomycin resistance protein/Dihydroxybiphenyl dioxygenase n=1 Tax=Mytilinidion resinicola TaxID=574789 RepID=A0A6A6Y7G0_9PEZI|nr:Glyoxalase/Bleomycin resistance protein/Dihydroxybiphenyl dioxygenase [Mytilinidion resinicola]KAF2804539.1 Glyoxalase/Bleomycin resistance protein/Dihydroxybiphenyl dioxygenase [Mytilinidion resinicola]